MTPRRFGDDMEVMAAFSAFTQACEVSARSALEKKTKRHKEGAAVGVSLDSQLATFDALQAQCYKSEERQRLLGIIEEAFGDFNVFNAAVRSILTQRSQVVAVEKVVQQV